MKNEKAIVTLKIKSASFDDLIEKLNKASQAFKEAKQAAEALKINAGEIIAEPIAKPIAKPHLTDINNI